MKKIIGSISFILFLVVAAPEHAQAAFRISTSKMSFCSSLTPTMSGKSKIFFGDPQKYRGLTISTFHTLVAGVVRLRNVQNSGWALETSTGFTVYGVMGADALIQTAHIYQKKTCGFWEDWVERSTARSGCGTSIAIPS